MAATAKNQYLADAWRGICHRHPCGWCTGSEFVTPGLDDDRMRCARPTSVRFGKLVGFEQKGCPEFRVIPAIVEDALTDWKDTQRRKLGA